MNQVNKAIYTSVISKVLTVGIQVFSFPIVINALGVEQFGVYLLVTSFISWFLLGNIGIGAALTRDIAKEYCGEISNERCLRLIFTALKIILLVSFLLVIIFLIVKVNVPVKILFGQSAAGNDIEIQNTMNLVFITVLLHLIGSVGEAGRLGIGKQFETNFINIVTNLFSLVALLYTANNSPSLYSLVLSLNGMVALGKLLNLFTLVYNLKSSKESILITFNSSREYKLLLSTSYIFTLGDLSKIASTHGIIYFVGYITSPTVVVFISFIQRTITLLGGLYVMITQPLSSELIRLHSICDYQRIIFITRKYFGLMLLSIIIIFLGIVIFGSDIYRVWSSGEVYFSAQQLVIIGLLFIANILSHVFFVVLYSFNYTKIPIFIMLIEAVSLYLCLYAYPYVLDVTVIISIMLVCSFFLSVCVQFYFVIKEFSSWRKFN